MKKPSHRRAAESARELWTCPSCGERFISPRLWHSCGRFSYDALFARSEPHVRRIFDTIAMLAHACGPVRVYPQKTRVVIQARIRFAGGHPQKSCFMAGFLLPTGTESPRLVKRERLGSRHYFAAYVRVCAEKEIDREVRRLMKLAYKIGCQEHLREPA